MTVPLERITAETPRIPAWRIIWGIIRFRPGYYALNALAMLALNLLWLLPALIQQAFMNLLAPGVAAGWNVWTLVAFLVATETATLVSILGLIRTNVPFSVHVMTLLRRNMLGHILRRPGAAALPDSPGEAVSRFRTDVWEIPLFALWLNDLAGSLCFCAVGIVLMWRIDAPITVVALLPFLVVGFIANRTTERIEAYRRASRRASGIVSGFIGELFGAVQAVKVAAAERAVIAHFHTLNEDRRVISLKDRLFNEILGSIFRNATNISTGIILLLVAEAMRARTFSVGDFALFVYLLGGISDVTAFCGLLVARYKQIGVSVERMLRLMEGERPEALTAPCPLALDERMPDVAYPTAVIPLQTLEARGLTFAFPGTAHGIAAIDLALPRGSFTVITGRNGAGKTTLLRVLLGLLAKEAGEIRWNGATVADPAAFFVPPQCAYTAQVPRLFSATLRENLLLGLPRADAEVRAALRAAVLEEDAARLDDGLETRVGPKGVKLSGGQLQRAAAARMFVRAPELLVFDDLSSALDVETEARLWERVFERAGATCLVVSHRRAALRRADRIIVLKDGRVEDTGTLAELLERCPEMQRLWHGEVVADAGEAPSG